MKKWIYLAFFVLCTALTLSGKEPLYRYRAEKGDLIVSLQIPKGTYYYREHTCVTLKSLSGKKLFLKEEPVFRVQKDSVSGEKVQVYAGHSSIRWVFAAVEEAYPLKVTVRFQGCSDGSDGKEAVCFMPEEHVDLLDLVNGKLHISRKDAVSGERSLSLPEYRVIRSASGYMPAKEFLAFLKGEERKSAFADLAGKNFFWMVLIIFAGGIALNLTPCVLPMIPINLVMIGGRDPSRVRSVLNGLTYGSGMALAYGAAGVAAVMTQSTFGSLDSTWYFNALTCVIFLILGLSMFDIFTLDFSRFHSGNLSHLRSLRYMGVFLMGCLTALLAGACVAPVIVAVLIQAGKMYNNGELGGLLLPFVLGLGMALPWPFAAAGLAVLPKPGKWMKYVKYVLGVLIFSLGFYYGALAWESSGLSASSPAEDAEKVYADLERSFKESGRTGKEIFLDFTAQWCKNCKTMEKTVFTNPAVRRELERFIFVKVDASDLKDPVIEKILQKFDVKGLPAYRILRIGRSSAE